MTPSRARPALPVVRPAMSPAYELPAGEAAGRFSTKCATPSLKSSDFNDSIMAASAAAEASASDWK